MPPPETLKRTIELVLQGLPFRQVKWAQTIYNEYRRQQRPPSRQYYVPIWDGFRGARHPWIQVNEQRPKPGKRMQQAEPTLQKDTCQKARARVANEELSQGMPNHKLETKRGGDNKISTGKLQAKPQPKFTTNGTQVTPKHAPV